MSIYWINLTFVDAEYRTNADKILHCEPPTFHAFLDQIDHQLGDYIPVRKALIELSSSSDLLADCWSELMDTPLMTEKAMISRYHVRKKLISSNDLMHV